MKATDSKSPIITVVHVNERGAFVIPAEIRKLIGIHSGSHLMVVGSENAIILMKAQILGEMTYFDPVTEE
jgi:AbrB family looped-hinge helix DNA binding protein